MTSQTLSDEALRGAPRRQRRAQLIEATIGSIATYGLSNTTLAKVTQAAGLSPGIVSFYFNSKDALLLATLRYISEEFEQAWEAAHAAAGPNVADQLAAQIDVQFDPAIATPERIAVWYAFWSESRAREDYMRLCGDSDAAYFERTLTLCRRIIEEGGYDYLNAEAVARALDGMVDSAWQSLLVNPAAFEAEAQRRLCHAFLASVFPRHFEMPAGAAAARPATRTDAQREGAVGRGARDSQIALPETLAAWTYNNTELFALERAQLFLRNWQIVCHVSDLPAKGDYVTLDLSGVRALVVRGEEGALHAFHNVCRHRAHAVAQGEAGNCRGVLQCPYHGWSYRLDGRLKAVPGAEGFPGLDRAAYGLRPIELEVFQGFVFLRVEGSGPAVAERLAPVAAELAHYRLEDMQPLGKPWVTEIAVDWKNFWDNYLEGYHFVTGHPGLFDLMGEAYEIEAFEGGVARLSHAIKKKPARSWSARHYQTLLPEAGHLPAELRRRWSYFPLFPGMAFDIYPDYMDFLQVIPTGPGRCRLRACAYGLPDARRETRASRYLGMRLINKVQREDETLTDSVQRGLESSGYGTGLLSDKECLLVAFQDWIRDRLPVAGLPEAPAAGTLAARNVELASW